MVDIIIYETIKFVFNCRPMAVNDSENHVQFKFAIEKIPSKRLYTGFERLRNLYGGQYAVRVLFIPNGIMQVLIGRKEFIAPIGINNSDFILDIC